MMRISVKELRDIVIDVLSEAPKPRRYITLPDGSSRPHYDREDFDGPYFASLTRRKRQTIRPGTLVVRTKNGARFSQRWTDGRYEPLPVEIGTAVKHDSTDIVVNFPSGEVTCSPDAVKAVGNNEQPWEDPDELDRRVRQNTRR